MHQRVLIPLKSVFSFHLKPLSLSNKHRTALRINRHNYGGSRKSERISIRGCTCNVELFIVLITESLFCQKVELPHFKKTHKVIDPLTVS